MGPRQRHICYISLNPFHYINQGAGWLGDKLKDGTSYVGDKVGDAKDAVVSGAGLSAPDLAQTQADSQYLRDIRGTFLNEYNAQQPGQYDAVAAQRAGMTGSTAAQMGRAANVNAASAGAAPTVQAPTLSPLERTVASRAESFQLAPAERAQASAAEAGYIGPTERAYAPKIDPTVTAETAQISPAVLARAQGINAAQLNTSAADQSRGIQQEAVGAVRDVLSGKAPSVAEMQLKNSANAAIAQQNSIAAGARGLSMAGARRQKAQNESRIMSDLAANASLLRAQEQAGARGQLGALGSDIRGQDLGQATTTAGLNQDASKFSAGAENQASLANAGFENTRASQQAQLATGTNQFNAGAANTRALSEAGIAADVNKFNAGAANARDTVNAQLQTSVNQGNADRFTGTSQFNAGAGNAVNLAQGQLSNATNLANAGFENSASQFNAGQTNTRGALEGQMNLEANTGNANRTTQNNQFNANLAQDAGKFNADAANTRTQAQGQLDTQNSQFNAGQFNQNQQFNTNQTNTTATQNADRGLQSRQIDENARNALRGDVLGATTGAVNADQGISATEEAGKTRRTEFISNTAKSAAAAAAPAASDRRVKKNIDDVSHADVMAFLDSLSGGKEWDYKNPSAPGQDAEHHVGEMAQTIDNTKMGRGFVKDTPNGKMLDAGDAVGPMLVALKFLNERIDKLQGGRRAVLERK